MLLIENDINTAPFTPAVHDCVPPLPWSVTEADLADPNRWAGDHGCGGCVRTCRLETRHALLGLAWLGGCTVRRSNSTPPNQGNEVKCTCGRPWRCSAPALWAPSCWCATAQSHRYPNSHRCPPCPNPPREDLRHLPICSVDPPGCKDIDDALHVRWARVPSCVRACVRACAWVPCWAFLCVCRAVLRILCQRARRRRPVMLSSNNPFSEA